TGLTVNLEPRSPDEGLAFVEHDVAAGEVVGDARVREPRRHDELADGGQVFRTRRPNGHTTHKELLCSEALEHLANGVARRSEAREHLLPRGRWVLARWVRDRPVQSSSLAQDRGEIGRAH